MEDNLELLKYGAQKSCTKNSTVNFVPRFKDLVMKKCALPVYYTFSPLEADRVQT